jgi:hypothetical protein
MNKKLFSKNIAIAMLLGVFMVTPLQSDADHGEEENENVVSSAVAAATNTSNQTQLLIDQISELTKIVVILQQQIQAILDAQNTVVEDTTPVLEGYRFTKDLKKNDSDVEVVILQKALNKAGFIVSASGAGSLGNETDFFGAKTESAVGRLQSQYAAIALHPAGYYLPTGIVDSSTRTVLNQISSAGQIVDTVVQNVGVPRISSITPRTGPNGSTVTIYGENFHPTNNTINTSISSFKNVPSPDGRTLSVTIYSESVAAANQALLDEIPDPTESFGVSVGADGHHHSAETDPDAFTPAFVRPGPVPVKIEVYTDKGFSNSVTFNLL